MTGSFAYSVAHAISSPCLQNKTMFILSSPPTTFFPVPRVPFSHSSSKPSSSSSISLRSATTPSLSASCSCSCSLTFKVKAKENVVSANMAASVSSRTFLNARNEQELLAGIRKEVEAGSLPPNVAAGMEEVYNNYKKAVIKSGVPKANETVLSNMSVFLDRVFLDVTDPFVFQPHHKAKREPFDYYMFGQNYIRPLVDFRNSYVGNMSVFIEMEEKLKQVLISNMLTFIL